jgi:uncharacterized membrane protein YeaQ/YmgE (transglycosylase-associated protein family)
MSFLVWIIAGIIAGWLTGMLVRGAGYGLLGDLAIGLIGGLIGGALAGVFGIQPTNLIGSILVAAFGGVVLVWLLHLVHPGAGLRFLGPTLRALRQMLRFSAPMQRNGDV